MLCNVYKRLYGRTKNSRAMCLPHTEIPFYFRLMGYLSRRGYNRIVYHFINLMEVSPNPLLAFYKTGRRRRKPKIAEKIFIKKKFYWKQWIGFRSPTKQVAVDGFFPALKSPQFKNWIILRESLKEFFLNDLNIAWAFIMLINFTSKFQHDWWLKY